MITPFPERFPTKVLEHFNIGEVEPSLDELLLPCFCDTPAIERFLRANKGILLGGKGTGKTALFTLLKHGDREFANPRRARQRLIAIDSDVEYSRLKYAALSTIKSDIPDEDIQFRYLWEIYIIYCLLVELKDDGILSDHRAKSEASRFLEIFDAKGKTPSLMEFLGAVKKTAGFRVDISNPAFPTPDFYVSVEPGDASASNAEKFDVSLSELKASISRYLARRKQYVYIVVDNIDDFVSREEYEIQKLLLQGLLRCSRSFISTRNIKIRLLLRTELFEHINFSQVGGYDKVAPTTIKLSWSPSDIWKFLGERILWNFKHHLAIEHFEYSGDGQSLDLEPWDRKVPWYHRLLMWLHLYKPNGRDSRDSKDVSLRDEAYKSAITTIFPRTIKHYDGSGNVEDIDLFSFIETHFKLGNGELTPRILMIYVQKVFELCADYYAKNDEPFVEKDENGEFPLLKRKEILAAYGWLQEEVLRIFLGSVTINEWRTWLEIIFKQKGKKTTFSYRAVRKLIGVGDDVEIRDFLAYLTHLGVFQCRDTSVALEQRHYELPILLHKNFASGLHAGS